VTTIKNILFIAVAVYAAILALLYLTQRRMMYVPDRSRIAPALAGFTKAEAQEIRTQDGETLVAWYAEPAPGKPVILYFHGNAGQLANRAQRFDRLTEDGTGLLALSYRGYGGSTGSPSENALVSDARLAYERLRSSGIAPERIVLIGESLGTGVAVALAAEVKIAALVLEAPFSSTVDVAADIYWMFPVRLLMKDQFRSDLRISGVKAPLLVIHGTADRVIPLRFGERIYAMAHEPKTFVRAENAGHQPLDNSTIMASTKKWLADKAK
jgi:fermentation-respiration switch protein FrsA (DUF1100 family)